MNINEEKRSQWQALKGMGFKAHWEYFWDYYKIHVIVAVFVLALVIGLIKDIADRKPYALNATFINTYSMNEADDLASEFAEYENIDQTKLGVYVDATSTIDMTKLDSMSVASAEKIYAQIAAGDLDVFMSDSMLFETYAGNDMFCDLRDYFTAEELNALGDRVYYYDYAEIVAAQEAAYSDEIKTTSLDSTSAAESSSVGTPASQYTFVRKDPAGMKDPIPFGIIMEDNVRLKALEYYPQSTPIIGILAGTPRPETSADFIRFLLK